VTIEIKRYQHQPSEAVRFSAVQFDGTLACAQEIARWLAPVHVDVGGLDLVWGMATEVHIERRSIGIGGYVIRYEDGQTMVMPNEQFIGYAVANDEVTS